MAKISILFGVLLCALAAWGYWGGDPETRSPTALIPAAVGVPLLLCGFFALKEAYRKHAMHIAAVFGLLGTLAAGGRGLPKIGVLFAEGGEGNKRAVGMVLLMFLLSAFFLGLCIKSFIEARRARQSGASE